VQNAVEAKKSSLPLSKKGISLAEKKKMSTIRARSNTASGQIDAVTDNSDEEDDGVVREVIPRLQGFHNIVTECNKDAKKGVTSSMVKFDETCEWLLQTTWVKNNLNRIFTDMDHDGNGSLNFGEVYAGILLLYVQMKGYGLRSNPPSRERIMELLKIADENDDENLDKDEWKALADLLFLSLSTRVCGDSLVQFILAPVVTYMIMGPFIDWFVDFFQLPSPWPDSWNEPIVAMRLPLLASICTSIYFSVIVPVILEPLIRSRVNNAVESQDEVLVRRVRAASDRQNHDVAKRQ
jgi:hypothetical protein